MVLKVIQHTSKKNMKKNIAKNSKIVGEERFKNILKILKIIFQI